MIKEFIQSITGTKTKPQVKEALVPFTPASTFNQSEKPIAGTTQALNSYNSWVYVCTSKLAQSVAAVNLKLYKKTKGEVEEVEEHPALDLLAKVNDSQTFYDLIELYQTFMELAGESFWWLVRDGSGEVISIYPYMRPDRMDVIPGTDDFISGYVYNVPGSGEKVPFDAKDIIHFKTVNPTDPYRGQSTVIAASLAVGTDEESSAWNWQFFKNSAKSFGILTSDQTITQDMYERISTQWDTKHRGTTNAHKIAILGGGLQYSDAGLSQRDMDFSNLRKWTRDEILAAFKVPLGVINPDESITYANANAAKAVFMEQVIVPKMVKLTATLNEFLLPNYDEEGLFFDFENPVPENAEDLRLDRESGIKNGYLTQNEVRQGLGLDEVEGADVLSLPGNLVPTGQAKAKQLKKTFNVNIGRSKSEIIEEAVADEVRDKMDHIISTESVAEKRAFKVWSDRQHIVTKQANKLKTTMKQFFMEQWEERVKPKYVATQTLQYRLDLENDLLRKAIEPILKTTFTEGWQEAMGLVGNNRFEAPFGKYTDEIGMKFVQSVNTTQMKRLERTIAKAKKEELSLDETVKALDTTYGKVSRNKSEEVSRTEIQRLANWSTLQAYKDSGVVTKKVWYTAQDERVCPICRPLQGKTIGLDAMYHEKGTQVQIGVDKEGEPQYHTFSYDNVAAPPAHVNCRCTILPETISVSEL